MKYKIHLSLTKEEINRLKTMTEYFNKMINYNNKTKKNTISMSSMAGECISATYITYFLKKTHYTPEG